MSLRVLLAPLAAAACALAPAQIAQTPEEARPLKKGVKAPDVKLLDLQGKAATLWHEAKNRKTVIVFYRGGWCPFCSRHLAELGQVYPQVQAKGYQLLAISPDTPENLRATMDRQKAGYRLFSDPSGEAMQKFGVAFRVPDDTFTMYRDKYGIDLEKASGTKSHVLPVPSVFVLNAQGRITYVHSNPDYKVRLSGKELLAAL